MRTVLLALLLTLLLPATARADVSKPGVAEIRQDGTRVEWVMAIDADELTNAAGGETKEVIAGFINNNTRMSVDAQSCAGGMYESTPHRHGRTPYARVVLRFSCPQEFGTFAVINETFFTSAVDYELGGASGTFRFDVDHTLLEATSPTFPRWLRDGFDDVVLGWQHVLFLAILLLGARTAREFAAFAGTVAVGSVLGLVLAVEGVVNVPERTLEVVTVASIVGVAALPVLGITGRAQLSVVFALALAHGLALAVAVPSSEAVPGFATGLVLGEALVISLVGALPLAWRALGRTPGARAPGRARSAAR